MIKRLIYLILEEIYSGTLGFHELVNPRSNPNYNLKKWTGIKCSAYMRTYVLEWSYFDFLKNDYDINSFWFKDCNCRTCYLLRLLLKGVLFKHTAKTRWFISNVLLKIGFDQKFIQFSRLCIVFTKNHLYSLKLRCLHIIKALKQLLYLLRVDSKLRQTKKQLFEVCSWIPSSFSTSYTEYGLHRSILVNAGKIGLLLAINRFDFLNSQHFPAYAKWWVKQKIIYVIINSSKEYNAWFI